MVKATKDYQAEEVAMKKFVICILTLLVLAPLAPLAASADTFITNTTQVLPYVGTGTTSHSGYTDWMDNIPGGASSLYKIFGYEIVRANPLVSADVTLNIYTNMSALGGGGPIPNPVGDLFLNMDGTFASNGFTTALDLSDDKYRAVGGIATYNTSMQLWKNTGWIYGGEYRTSNTAPATSGNVPVEALGNVIANGLPITASWSKNITSNTVYHAGAGTDILSILFTGMDGNENLDVTFLWAAASCANGVVFGVIEGEVSPPQVPVPPSALLLGTGLLGLGLLRYRRKVS